MISRALKLRIRRLLIAFVLVGVGVAGLAPPSSAAPARKAFVLTDPAGDAVDMQPSNDIVRLRLEIQRQKMVISMTLKAAPTAAANYHVSGDFPGGCGFRTVYSPGGQLFLSETRGFRQTGNQSTLSIECDGTTFASKNVLARQRGKVVSWTIPLTDLPKSAVANGWIQNVRGFSERSSFLFGDVGLQTDDVRSSRSWKFGTRTAKVPIIMSNVRYCQGSICHQGQFGYARPKSVGPTGPNNEAGVIDVHPGDRIVWTNVDMFCDFNDGPRPGPSPIECPGHDVVFEDGRVRSPRLASQWRADVTKPARSPESWSWVVPAKTRPGKLIRYYCSEADRTDSHADFGMTGVLRVL